MQNDCQHPKHQAYFEEFLRKYPTATREGGCGTIDLVDPEEWFVQDDPKKNTVMCCQMCGITEGILRSKIRNMTTPGYGTTGQFP
jgi:hypothetical protein